MPHPYLYQKIQIQNHHLGGDAATGTGYAGPGFHTWPLSHIPQDTDPKPRGPCPNGATHTSPGCNPGNLPPTIPRVLKGRRIGGQRL